VYVLRRPVWGDRGILDRPGDPRWPLYYSNLNRDGRSSGIVLDPIMIGEGVRAVDLWHASLQNYRKERVFMEKGQKLVIIGMGGVGGPAAMLARKLLPGVDITVIREEDRFIVR